MPSFASSTVVLVDTNVVSRSLLPTRVSGKASSAPAWNDALVGKSIVIAVQTRVELLAWPVLKNWGERRRAALAEWIDAVPTLDITSAVQDAFVDLTVAATTSGHALHDAVHVADRWIAATAIAAGIPLASDDGIFRDVPGLELLEPIT